MPINEDYLNFIKEQLENFKPFEAKKIFGGIGFFKEKVMFALIGKDTFHLRADDTTKHDFEERGMKNFMPSAKKKGMPYWEVPITVIEDKKTLCEWAEKAYEVAIYHKKK